MLYYVDAVRVGRTRITPGDGVMARNARAPLDEASMDRITRVQVDERYEALDIARAHQLGIDAVDSDRVRPAPLCLPIVMAVRKRQHASLAQHDVKVEFAPETLIELQGMIEKGGALRPEIIRARDLGVATGVAAAEEAFLEHGDVAGAVFVGEIVRGRQAMSAGADDHNIIGIPEFGISPQGLPVPMPPERVADERKSGIAFHAASSYATGKREFNRDPSIVYRRTT